jgi:sugar lactone lactonase YvrE
MKIRGLLVAWAMLMGATVAEAAPPTTVIDFDLALGQLPESIAADVDGQLYVSMANTVTKLTPALDVVTLATLPVPAGVFATGVKFGPDGMLYVGSGGFDPSAAASFVWRVSPASGAVDPVVELNPNGFPNDIAFDDDDNFYVTDSFLGVVWKVDSAGTASQWLSDPALLGDPVAPALGAPFGVNGIAFDKQKRHLYFTNTDYGTVLRIRVLPNGDPGNLEVFAADPRLVGADGIAFDRSGKLYVAVNAQDRIATVNKHGNVQVVAEGGLLDSPSAFAFGVAPCDRHTLFISNFAIARANGLKPGQPRPGILSMRVAPGGLPLP